MKPAWARRSQGMHFLYRVVLFLAWLYCKICYRNRVYGNEFPLQGGAIIASNHTSFLDPILLSISWPEEVHFLARESLFKILGFGAFIRALNAHPVSGDAGDVAVFRSVISLMKEGKKVILFPEGTRSHENKLGLIKPGIGLLISRSNAAIIPAYIHGSYNIWSRKRKFPKLWGKTACVFGAPIEYSAFAHLDKREAQAAIAEKLSEAIFSLRAWYEAGAKGALPV
ncbi:MAG: lysophospholipid acyltransferase family protein [Chlamydiota bacterium]